MVENIDLVNILIDNKEIRTIEEVLINLEQMSSKLKVLPSKLKKANESFLYEYVVSI